MKISRGRIFLRFEARLGRRGADLKITNYHHKATFLPLSSYLFVSSQRPNSYSVGWDGWSSQFKGPLRSTSKLIIIRNINVNGRRRRNPLKARWALLHLVTSFLQSKNHHHASCAEINILETHLKIMKYSYKM